MKHAFIVTLVSLGLTTGALAQTSNGPSPSIPYAVAARSATPDLSLPSPCNTGVMIALGSGSVSVSPDVLNFGGSDRAQLVDYKCAVSVPPPRQTDRPPPATLDSGK
jgi:hypothetical protein